MNEITKTKNARPKSGDRNARFVRLFFWFCIISVYFFALNSVPLLGPDEPRYAQVAREMFERNDWTTPTLGGFDWFEKPALLYWLQIFFYKIFGVSEFSARFGSALFGLGTIFSLWVLGRAVQSSKSKVQSSSENQNADSALSTQHSALSYWLALISASSIGLLAFSRGASFDIILTFPITAALVGFFIFDLTQRREDATAQNEKSQRFSLFGFHFSLAAFYFFIGVALLAKGLVGVVFPLAIVAFYFVLSRKLPSKTFVFSLFWGTILSLSVAAVWYVPMYLANGWEFVDEFFVQHHFARYASNKYQHPQPFWFFFVVLPLMTIPWLPFFLVSIWDLFSRKGANVQGEEIKPQKSTNEHRLGKVQKQNSSTLDSQLSALKLFSFSWLFVPLVFFSFSGSKLPGYILPALPACLILTAEYVSRFVQKSDARKTFVQLVALAMFAVVAVVLQFFVVSNSRTETVKTLIETANANGYTNEKVFNLNTISHNAEFYAAGRLVRTPDGKQRRFFDAAEIVAEMKRENASDALVLVPVQFLNQLTGSDSVEAKILGDNTELAIVSVEIK